MRTPLNDWIAQVKEAEDMSVASRLWRRGAARE